MNTHSEYSRKKIFLCFITVFLIILNVLSAQDTDQWLVIGKTVNFHSEVLDEDRSLLIHLPLGYERSNDRYPVMFLLDGISNFHHTTGITYFLSSLNLMPGMIVIGIANVDRSRDFSPTHVDNIPTSGGAKNFLTFLSDELIPYINEEYRTHPYRILVGHSFGGTFATYTFLENPDLFNAYIAISPYLHYDNDWLVKKADNDMNLRFQNETFFYMTLGNEPEYVPAISEFITIVDNKRPENLHMEFVQMEDESHGSVPHLSIYRGLEAIYSEWVLTLLAMNIGLEAVTNHYDYLSSKYGYKIEPPEYVINNLGYQKLRNGEIDDAIAIFELNVENFPESANVYDSLGEAYETNEQFTLAEKNYKKACKQGKKIKDSNWSLYCENWERVKLKLEAGK